MAGHLVSPSLRHSSLSLGRAGSADGRAGNVEFPATSSGSGVRLTLRAKRLIAATATVAALGLTVGLAPGGAWGGEAGAGAPGESVAQRTVTVRPGDNLWSIASRTMPTVETVEAVEQLKALNGPSASHLMPGQRLELPTPGGR